MNEQRVPVQVVIQKLADENAAKSVRIATLEALLEDLQRQLKEAAEEAVESAAAQSQYPPQTESFLARDVEVV